MAVLPARGQALQCLTVLAPARWSPDSLTWWLSCLQGVPANVVQAFPTYAWSADDVEKQADRAERAAQDAAAAGPEPAAAPAAAPTAPAAAGAAGAAPAAAASGAEPSAAVPAAAANAGAAVPAAAGSPVAASPAANGAHGPAMPLPFNTTVPAPEAGARPENPSCTVCLCEYEGGEMIRRLPCMHEFHMGCIDKWLTQHTTCPICRVALIPTIQESDGEDSDVEGARRMSIEGEGEGDASRQTRLTAAFSRLRRLRPEGQVQQGEDGAVESVARAPGAGMAAGPAAAAAAAGGRRQRRQAAQEVELQQQQAGAASRAVPAAAAAAAAAGGTAAWSAASPGRVLPTVALPPGMVPTEAPEADPAAAAYEQQLQQQYHDTAALGHLPVYPEPAQHAASLHGPMGAPGEQYMAAHMDSYAGYGHVEEQQQYDQQQYEQMYSGYPPQDPHYSAEHYPGQYVEGQYAEGQYVEGQYMEQYDQHYAAQQHYGAEVPPQEYYYAPEGAAHGYHMQQQYAEGGDGPEGAYYSSYGAADAGHMPEQYMPGHVPHQQEQQEQQAAAPPPPPPPQQDASSAPATR